MRRRHSSSRVTSTHSSVNYVRRTPLSPPLFSYVCIAMEALDQLLMACHCQSINLFVESFLKMVRKLLESDKPNLQILGTNSVSHPVRAARDRPPVCGSTTAPFERSDEEVHRQVPGFQWVFEHPQGVAQRLGDVTEVESRGLECAGHDVRCEATDLCDA